MKTSVFGGMRSCGAALAIVAALVAWALAAGVAQAADITATGSQPIGANWNNATWTGGQWSDGLAPSAGKTYSTGAFEIRTAISTFGGDSLRIANGGTLRSKQGVGGLATVNLILDGGTLLSGDDTTAGHLFKGNLSVLSSSFVNLSDTGYRRLVMGSGAFSGSGGITITGVDVDDYFMLDTTMTSTHTGNWTINGGRLIVTRDDQIYDTASVTLSGTTTSAHFDFRSDQKIGSLSGTGTVNTGASGSRTLSVGGNNEHTTFSGKIENGSGTVSLTKEGTGTLTLNGANGYTGTTTVSNGTLALGAADRISNSSALSVAGGTFDLGGFTETVAAVSMSSGTISNGTLTGTSYSFSNSGSVSANLAGSGVNLTKSGAGTVTISSASNSYSGTTNVTGGTLEVSGTGSINSSSGITVSSGAKFVHNSSVALSKAPTLSGNGINNRAVLGGTGPIGVALTLDNVGDVLSPGNSPGIQEYTVSQTWNSFSYDWEVNDFSDVTGLNAGSDFDQISITGALTLSGGSGSYILNVLSLTSGNVSGDVPNFSEINRSWNIITTTAGITGFDAANWSINTAGFTNAEAGTWGLTSDGNNLILSYNAIPEPAAALLGSIGMLLLLRRHKSISNTYKRQPV